ncbi:MAG TPA: sugar transferase [Gemmatimonadetes bacterium]|nr:sugar transferase [Gemmatimonadota bacterium]|tara:strand:- start:758 stop:1525 length:768 start_codon:yes stop_codon:yes gene_type:complete
MVTEAPLSTGAASCTQALDLPLSDPPSVPESVIPSREEIDWDAFLPERANTLRWKFGSAVKRTIDIVGAGIGLILLLPVFAVIAPFIKLTSRGSILYRSRYLGKRSQPFVGYKFRSMVENADDLKSGMAHLNHMHGPAFKIRNDPRITPLGRFLRKYSLDELPQLWSVLKGDMSLVGPRPPLPEEFEEFEAWHRGKLVVTPGITCYWQINGRSDIHDFNEWIRLDLKYIEEWNLWTDVKILARTVPVVLRGHGAY